jgi:hypothetical protein
MVAPTKRQVPEDRLCKGCTGRSSCIARAEVEVGLGLSVLDTIDGINTFLALCELKD